MSAAVKLHAHNKLCQVSKFVSIIRKNNDVPFIVNKRLFDAAQISALLYGCESWVAADVKPIIKLYNWCMKELLGVRRATVNSVCLPDIVRYRQHKFYYNVV